MATDATSSECAISKSVDEFHDAGDHPMKDLETSEEISKEASPEEIAPEELCDDPFAVCVEEEENTTQKMREISIEEKPESVKNEPSPVNAESDAKEPEQMDEDNVNEDKQEEEEAGDDDEDEEEEEEDAEENAAVRAAMEADWQREATEEKEKNEGMTALLDLIRSKGSKGSKKRAGTASNSRSPSQLGAAEAVPELKLIPFGMDGNLQLRMDGDRVTSVADAKRKRRLKKKEKERAKKKSESALVIAEGTRNKKKVLKQKLKQQLHRKRETEIQRHRKETEQARALQHQTEAAQEAEDAECEDEDEVEEREEEKEETESEIASRASTVPLGDVDSESESDSGSDPEDLARAALMAKPATLSKEARALLDEEAEEEDDEEGGNGAETALDEHEEEFGIAKDLLADKAENRRLRKLKKEYDDKRVDVHRQLCLDEDAKQLQLIKSAFVDGEYAQLKGKATAAAFLNSAGAGDDSAQANAFEFNARTANAQSSDPASYLSDDEEKNEFCVYTADGHFNDVNTIRMKMMEWNRLREKDAVLTNDTEEREERQQRLQRKRRVQRKEFLVRSRSEMGEAALCGDEHAAKLLEKARNKKLKPAKKPTLGKAATTAFMGMGMGMGAVGGSSFMKHRSKCVEKAKIAESRNKTGGKGGSKKAVVFERVKKRKRDGHQQADHGIFKKRRMQ